uniref:Uncharacterized protein n=1 Tax=Aquila chrysaetos chrysaetos TaxID=223781 RepID=A0A663EQ62_AQUCH
MNDKYLSVCYSCTELCCYPRTPKLPRKDPPWHHGHISTALCLDRYSNTNLPCVSSNCWKWLEEVRHTWSSMRKNSSA